MQLFAKFKKNWRKGFRATLKSKCLNQHEDKWTLKITTMLYSLETLKTHLHGKRGGRYRKVAVVEKVPVAVRLY